MHEVWKRQQVNENTRKMRRAKVLVNSGGKMGKEAFGRTRFGKNR